MPRYRSEYGRKEFVAMPTLSDRIRETAGRSSGFDYLRLCLSISVVLLHTVGVSYGGHAEKAYFDDTVLKPFYRLVLPMFFALSGYLVAGSLVRSKTIGAFLGLRIIRIYPALAVEVVLSAFILGPLLTTLPLADYFSHVQFRQYLLNVFGDVHFFLPGVFADNPIPLKVNAQLWTVPYELLCYIGLTCLALTGVVKKRGISVLAVIFMSGVLIADRFAKYNGHFLETRGVFIGLLLVVCFLAGVVMFLYRDIIPWSGKLAAASAMIAMTLVSVIPLGDYAAPVPIAYMTVYLGLTNFRRAGLLRYGDLSYGIFLYGFVVQQTVAHVLPWSRYWYLNFAISLPLTVLVAAVSWRYVERPALGLRSQLTRIETWYLSSRPSFARGQFEPTAQEASNSASFAAGSDQSDKRDAA